MAGVRQDPVGAERSMARIPSPTPSGLSVGSCYSVNGTTQTLLDLVQTAKQDPGQRPEILERIYSVLEETNGRAMYKGDKKGNTALHHAVYDDCLPILTIMLKYTTSPAFTTRNKKGMSPLDQACRDGQVKALVAILESVTDPAYLLNKADKNGKTPLHYAARQGQLDAVGILFSYGVDAKITGDGEWHRTALHKAARKGNSAIADLLLNRCPSLLDMQDDKGYTALHVAARDGHTDFVKALVDGGANVELKTDADCTALQLAVRKGEDVRKNIIEMLSCVTEEPAEKLTHPAQAVGIKNKAIQSGDLRHLAWALKQPAVNPDDLNEDGLSPLHVLCIMGHQQATKQIDLLIRAGASINLADKRSYTPLHYAITNGHTAITKHLLTNQADHRLATKEGLTALHLVAEKKHSSDLKMLNILLPYMGNVDINRQDKEGDTALHEACQTGNVSIVEALVTMGADVTITDAMGRTPLHEAALWATGEPVEAIIESLIEAGANMDQADKEKCTPLHLAARMGNCKAVKILMSHGADPSKVDKEGNTPYQLVLSKGHSNSAEMFAALTSTPGGAAAINSAPEEGLTPLHRTAEEGRPEVMRDLMLAGADPTIRAGNNMETPIETLYRPFLYGSRYVSINHDHQVANDLQAAKMLCETPAILATPSPILTALHLRDVFKELSHVKQDIRPDYKDLARQCENLAAALLEECYSMDQARVILLDNNAHIFRLAFSKKHKQFMATTFVQRLLRELWYDRLLPIVQSKPAWMLVLLYISSLILLPLAGLAYGLLYICGTCNIPACGNEEGTGCFRCKWKDNFHRYFRFIFVDCRRSALIKFWANLMSYLVFICILVIQCGRPFQVNAPLEAMDYLLTLWLAGQLLQEAKQMVEAPNFRLYITNSANSVDLVMFLLLITITFCQVLVELTRQLIGDATVAVDLQIVAEICTGLVTIIAFMRLTYYIQVHETFGPLQLSFIKMIKDVILVLMVLLVVLIAFSCGVVEVYSTAVLAGMNITEKAAAVDPTLPAGVPSAVQGISSVLPELFWALFGLSDINNFRTSFLPANYTGQCLIMLYLLIAVIVLLSMLTARMSDTYTTIRESANVDWNFARAELVMEFRAYDDLPVPLNLLMGLQTLVTSAVKLVRGCRSEENDDGDSTSSKHGNSFKLPCFETFDTNQPSTAEEIYSVIRKEFTLPSEGSGVSQMAHVRDKMTTRLQKLQKDINSVTKEVIKAGIADNKEMLVLQGKFSALQKHVQRRANTNKLRKK
ncbi:hypothetical protein Bbelb_361160 [Branchiostoma belcheri]|nr:hypothetical protein Bbelb_361160 [Branchiostoma belcheri]